MDFTAGYRIAHTHTHTAAACACWEEQTAKAVPKRLCSTTRLRVPLNSMTHFSQLGLAGWQGALVHAALNNWDCKVNVRRIAKDRSNPPHSARPPVSMPGSVSWLHTSKFHTSTVLESVLVMLFWNT